MHFAALNRACQAHKNAKKNEVLSTTVVTGVALLENHLLMRQLSYGELMLGTTSLFTSRYNVVAIYSVRE